MLWLALHLPALSLESWTALDAVAAPPADAAPGAADAAAPPDDLPAGAAPAPRPRALLHAHRITQVDAAARACGVRPGMQRATALALAPALRLGAADAGRDAQALRAVADVALGFSPLVCWATPPGWRGAGARPAAGPALVGVQLEVQACLRLFGGLPALLQRLRAALAPLGHRVRIAAAPTAAAAALLAGWGARAAGLDSADALVLGPHARDRAALQPLLDAAPLALLGLDEAALQALAGMGLLTLGDLGRLPRDGLARRFGPALLAAVDRARGQAPEAAAGLQPAPRFDQRIELLARADTQAQLLAGARLLLARLVAWAGARQARIARCTLVMHHERRRHRGSGAEPPPHSTLVLAPAQPTADAAHLQVLLAERLARQALPAPALELGLRCDALAEGGAPNGELFASPAGEREGLARLVERLQARLGAAQVQRLEPVADHRPEHATRCPPADPARLAPPWPAALQAAAAQALHSGALAVQPLWLLPQPQALPSGTAAALPLLDGRPLQLLAGPQRLETGWWDADGPAVRDYFIARTEAGALAWVYRHRLPLAQAAAADWFLQGWFG